MRLREYLDYTESLLAGSRISGPWALRLNVGLATGRDLLNMADLDNYAYPLANRLDDPALVSVWCTKQHRDVSFVRIDAAQEAAPPSPVLVVQPTMPYAKSAFKEQMNAAVAVAEELPSGAIRLQLSFLVGPARKWWHLWKPTIDSLEPLLGRDPAEKRAWHPLDGRITEIGMHVTVDPALRHEVVIGIAAEPACHADTTTPQGDAVPKKKWTVSDTCRFADAVIENGGRDLTSEKLDTLSHEVNCSRGAAETMVWRMQTVLGYPVKAADTSVLDRAVGQLFLDHDPRLRQTP